MRRLELVFIIALLIPTTGPAADGAQRPITPDDLFRIDEVGEIAIAPDGADAAIVIRHPASPGRGHGRPLLLGGDRSEVYLSRIAGGEPVRITDGNTDGSGFWRPLWSPDGRRLALLSNRGGDNVRLYVWDRETKQTRRLTADGVDLWAAVEPATRAPFAWIDNRRLLCALVAPGEAHTAFKLDAPTRKPAIAGWQRAERGAEPSVSVLDSRPSQPPTAPEGRLAMVDVDTTSVVTLADGNCVEAAAAPDGRHVAVVVEVGRFQPREGIRLPAFGDRSPSRVGVVTLSDPPAVRWVKDIEPKTKIRRIQFTWTSDSSQVAVLGKPTPDAERADTLFLVRTDGSARRAGGPDFRASATTRIGDSLLAQGQATGGKAVEKWWSIDVSDAGNSPAKLIDAPAVATWIPAGGQTALGVAAGKVWRFDAASGRYDQVPLIGGRKPSGGIRSAATHEVVIECRAASGAKMGEFVRISVDPNSKQTVFAAPDSTARLVEAGSNGSSVFTAVTPEGTNVWTTNGDGSNVLAFALNRFLAEIADAEFRVISYRGADGGPLKAHLLLPAGYHDGTRLPVVVWVYPGTSLDDRRGELLQKNSRHPSNLTLLAVRGYAVLVPSLPLGPEGKPADPLIELPKGVLPAVDKLVELGIADPARLAVMGHSYGGYCVYGLLTETKRFKAAIALSGITDLVAIHGTFDARTRYEADPFYNFFGPKWTEVGQGRMGAAPWADPDRYRRNSPITYVDRVITPLLMIHGDADFVPLQQAEAYYTALYRLGRCARLVRYWGEGHVVESPANVRDLWGQVFAWLDEHLPVPPKSASR
jgi:dipeptidyl aminopeptidase/acylaminoacyl peptidase